MRTKIFSAFKVSALALILSFGLSFVYAWTAPTISAPNGNVSAPINTSATAQTKTGGLNLATVSGGVGIGGGTTASWSKLDVTGPSVFRGDSSQVRLYETDAPNPQFSWHLSLNNGNLTTYYGNDATSGPYYPVMTQASSTGNVGIGDPVPADKLSVAGSIGATGNITSLSTTTTNGLKVANSTAGFGKVLTSDASGNASWQTSSQSIPSVFYTYNTATTSAPITVPEGLTSMRIILLGAGGGGGGGPSRPGYNYGGGGGGAGTLKVTTLNNLTVGDIYTLTVGTRGTGGGGFDPGTGATYSAGVAGGATVIKKLGATILSATGGGAGGLTGGSIGGIKTGTDDGGQGGKSAYGSWGTGGVGTGGGNAPGNGAGGGGGGYVWYSGSSGGLGSHGKAIIEFFDPSAAVTQAQYKILLDALYTQGIYTN